MSDLLVTYEGLSLPPAACAEAPPPETTPDNCSLVLPLTTVDQAKAAPRYLRFDRKKDRFVLSQNNTAENLTWIGQQKNLTSILDIARVLEGLLRKSDLSSVDVHALKLSLVQFVVTGHVRLYGPKESEEKRPLGQVDLANWALEIFATSTDEGIARLLGPLNVFRGDSGLSEAVKERIHFVNQVLDLRPKYRKFRSHFADPQEVDRWTEQDKAGREKYKKLLGFLRQTVVHEWLGNPLHYDAAFVASYGAYLSLNPKLDEAKGKAAYCQALGTGIAELRGAGESSEAGGAECRLAMDWVALPEEEVLRKSLRAFFLSEATRPQLEEAIEAESRKAGMTVDWLADRGRFAEAYALLENQVQIKSAEGEGNPSLSLDTSALRAQLGVWIGRKLTQRREHLLAALALLRRSFGEKGTPAPVRVFHQGRFVAAEWKLDAKSLQEIRDYQRDLEKQIRISEKRSELWLPLTELSACGAGLLGLGFSQTLGGLDSHPDLRLGLGATSSGLAGAGCSAGIGHYLFPKIAKVRNRYLWEGLTGAAGAAVGVGLYFLGRSILKDPGNPQKFPVDEYGP